MQPKGPTEGNSLRPGLVFDDAARDDALGTHIGQRESTTMLQAFPSRRSDEPSRTGVTSNRHFTKGGCRSARGTYGVVALLLLAICCPASAAAPDQRPNFVVVLCDDLGYGDLGCFGSPVIRTPNVDRFRQQSLKLNAFYATSCCSPSRASLITGRMPYRAGIYDWIAEGSPVNLPRSEISIATLLRSAGYATCHVGKWHLNGRMDDPQETTPGDHGFDHWFSTQNIAEPSHHNPVNFYRNGKAVGPLTGYAADLVADEGIGWLEHLPAGKPFCLFVWFHEPHEFIATAPEYQRLYPNVDKPERAEYYGNITQMDAAFGRLIQTLDRRGPTDNTLVLFTSDNGPANRVKHPYGSSGPFRGAKGEVYEGGIRVPGLLRFPGRVAAGQQCDEPLSVADVLPTFCKLAGIAAPADRVIDGADFAPTFAGRPIERKRPLYWQYNRAVSPNKVALRSGDWKLLAQLTGPELKGAAGQRPGELEIQRSAELSTFELYNLADDPAEKIDLASSQPEQLARMLALVKPIYHEIRAAGPDWPAWVRPKGWRPDGKSSR
jgi:arylsulfatase A